MMLEAALLLAAALLGTAVGVMAVRRRQAPGALALGMLAFGAVVWSVATAARLGALDLESAVFWYKVELLGMAPFGPATLLFALAYVGSDRLVTARNVVLLSIVPVVTLLLGWTNELHGLLWRGLELEVVANVPTLVVTGTLWWWTDTAYVYLLMVLALLILADTFARAPRLHQRQALGLVLAVTLPLLADLTYLTGVSHVNPAPMAFSLSALVLFVSFYRHRFLDVIPIAHRLVVEQMGEGLIVVDDTGRVAEMNPAAHEATGLAISDVIGRHVEESFAPVSDLRAILTQEAEAAAGPPEWQAGPGASVFEVHRRDLRGRRGRCRGRVHIMRDITRRKRIEDELLEAKAELESRMVDRTLKLGIAHEELVKQQRRSDYLMDLSPAVMYTAEANAPYDLTYMGANALQRLGYPASAFLADQDFWERHVHPNDRHAYDDMTAVFEKGKHLVDYQLRGPDGAYRWIRDSMTLARSHKGTPLEIVGILEDVTEQRGNEERSRQSQRMEAVGLLAGGVAHDFNNFLTAILGFSDMLAGDLDDDDPRRADALEIRNVAQRAAALTRQLLAFSRRQVMRPKVVDLNDVVRGLEPILGRLVGEHIEVNVRLEERLPLVEADPSQIEQVFMNLTVNARDAMPRGGRLTLETSSVWVSADHPIAHEGLPVGRYVRATVADTGVGMDERTRAHVFEPFFTTKGEAGTGLGLATVFGIVSQSGGGIRVDSHEGRGALFQVFLPLSMGEVIPEAPLEQRTPNAGVGRIMVVEDEAAVRGLATRTLRQQGYTVIEAADGEEALEILKECGEVDLILSDVVMPRMGGRELVECLAAQSHDAHLLLMSGYAGTGLTERGGLPPGVEFIDKPFSPADLVGKIDSILGPGRAVPVA